MSQIIDNITSDVQTTEFGKFLDECETLVKPIQEKFASHGASGLPFDGPAMTRYYVRKWREAGKPADSRLGTAGLERGLTGTKMALQLIGAEVPEIERELDELAARAREFTGDSR